VIQTHYQDSTIIILGHGTTQSESSSTTVLEHAASLRKLGQFTGVLPAFWKQEPFFENVIKEAKSSRVFIVPFFISEGYFSDSVIPKALGFLDESGTITRQLRIGAQTLFYTRPVGAHPAMTEVILSRAREVVKQFPFPACPKPSETSLVIAGHGTKQNSRSREAIDFQVSRISTQRIFADVHAVFLEEPPGISESYALASSRHVVVVPFFASDGLHVTEDIPVLLGEAGPVVKRRLAAGLPTWRNPTEKQGKLVWYSRSVGAAALMTNVILELVREAGGEVSAESGAGLGGFPA